MLEVLANFPTGAEQLILRFLAVLTETEKPSQAIVDTVLKLYREQVHDARFLIPILYGLPRDDIIGYLPELVQLPSPLLKSVVQRLLQPHSPISPSTLVTRLHLLDASTVPLKKTMEGTSNGCQLFQTWSLTYFYYHCSYSVVFR